MEECVWLNDDLVPLAQAVVSVNDRGFQYGDGFFETLRADQGRVWFLAEHLARLAASAQAFAISFPGNLPWEERLARLLAANGLTQGTARIKILLTRGEALGLGLPRSECPTLVIWATPYTPPPPEEYAAGWPVVVFPERRSTFLGRHKSLNYLFYLAARQYALEHGAKEALVLEANGRVSEGAATSLVFARRGKFYTPAAASALPGVTVAMLARGLAARRLPLQEVPTTLTRLHQADGVWLANALMGLMPVNSINGQALPRSPATKFLRELLDSQPA